MKQDASSRSWRRTARGRLKFELTGLAFAKNAGYTPEQYANFLWSSGADRWMNFSDPSAGEYLLKEADAFYTLYPEVKFDIIKTEESEAILIFKSGCLGGWGKDQWSMAKGLGLGKGHVCRYCRQAFRQWGKQLEIDVCPEPRVGNICVLRARKTHK